MADDGYVTIHRTTDQAEGELIAELFQREAIDARFHRVSAALIGAGPQLFEIRVDVPTESEARARELLTDLTYLGASDEGGATEPEAAAAGPAPRRALLAGVAFLVPGGGHFYARRPWTGLVLATAIICCYVAALGSSVRGGEFKGELAFGTFVALFLCDAVGGLRACRAENRGVHREQTEQLVRGLVLVLVAIAAGVAFAAAAATPRLILARRMQRFVVYAAPSALIVNNFDHDGRSVTVSQVGLLVGNGQWSRRYNVAAEGQSDLEVPPGDRRTMPLVIPEELRAACTTPLPTDPRVNYDPYPDRACAITFALTAAGPADPSSLLEADGVCSLFLFQDVGPEGTACDLTPHPPSTGRGGRMHAPFRLR